MRRMKWIQLMMALLLTTVLLAACGSDESAETGSEATVNDSTVEDASQDSEGASSEAGGESQASGDQSAEGLRTFVIVPEATTASYVVQEEFFAGALSKLGIDAGKKVVTGSTNEVQGQLQLDLGSANPLGDNRFTVSVNTFETEQDRRDNWIKDEGPRFNSFPTAEFVATSIQGAPASYEEGSEVTFTLVGDLTVRDVTNEVAFEVTATLEGDTITGVASTPSKLTDWGIEPPSFVNTLTVADDFEIRLDFTAREAS